MGKEYKIRTRVPEVFLRVRKGHFATMHSHTNYYIDVTTQKYRLSEAKAVAKEMVSSVLSQRWKVLKTPGNYNNQLGVPLTFSQILPEHEMAVIELGVSHFGDMLPLAKMAKPDAMLFTIIGRAHLEFFGDREGVCREKTSVLSEMDESAVAFVNGDDDLLRGLNCRQRKISFGLSEGCDVRAVDVRYLGTGGTACVIESGERRIPVTLPYGEHLIYAALEGAAVGLYYGLADEEILAGIGQYAPAGARASVERNPNIGLTIINDCYNANPDSVAAGLRTLMRADSIRRVAVLGDMGELGEDSRALHYETGRVAAACGVDLLITCGTLARAIAAEAGYDSYLELAYDQNYRDYTPAEAAAFTDAVKTCLVPLFREAGESGLLDDAYYGTPELDPDDALMTVMSIADSMGGDMKDTADFLLEYDLVNAEVSEKKVSDSYELYLPDYEAPYILAGTVGYAEDILTIAHEFGHAVDDFVHYEAQDSTDVSETLSQAMEYLTLFYLQDDAVYDSVLAYKLADVLRMYAEQGSYNAFEERIYAMRDEDLTLENVNAMALACAREFGLESEWGDAYDSTSWVDISHFFQQPMYIISYIASDSLAIQFYEQELAQQGRGLELYEDAMELAGDTEFMDLASELGLRDPLSAQQVQSIAKLMRDQLL